MMKKQVYHPKNELFIGFSTLVDLSLNVIKIKNDKIIMK